MQEKQVEQALVKAIKKSGGQALKFTSPGLTGVPDRLVLLPGGKAAFVEVKAPGKKPRPAQQRRIHQLQKLGFIATWIDHPAQIPEIINEIQAA